MWIVKLALERPYTFLVGALLILILSPIVILRTSTDIFPNIDIPVVSVVWAYTGLSPKEMEGRIVSVVERGLTTTVNDIEHIESQSLNGVAVIKIFFNPSVNVDMAVAQITAVSQTGLRMLPPGIQPPLVIVYNASSVPIVQLSLSSKTLSEQQLNDQGLNFVRPQLVSAPGVAIPFPYGGKVRQVTVDLSLPDLQARGLSPVDVVNAISAQSLVLPSGTAKIGGLEYNIALNGAPQTIEELNALPVKAVNGSIIYVRDVAHVRDGFAPQTNIVRQDGMRAVLLSVIKSGNVSTIEIVDNIKKLLPKVAATLPPEINIRALFDQSIFVRAAVEGVIKEGIIAACLTAIMILLFLGDWRSTVIIAVSIPLSVLSSIMILSAIGQTINIMTLGGLALAVGILVDDATVTIENIDNHLEQGKPLLDAILDGAHQIAVPAFVSTLCICIVFIPMFLLDGVARYLFVPLAEAVVFAVMSSYVISRTLVPTLAMYLLRHQHAHGSAEQLKSAGFFKRFQIGFEHRFNRVRASYRRGLEGALHHRALFAIVFLAFCIGSLGLIPFLGQDFFPVADAGQFRLHVRAKTGTRIEEMAKICDQVEAVIRQHIPSEQLAGILDNIGLPTSGINLAYSNGGSIGTADAEILVSLSEHHRPTDEYVRQLRKVLPREFPGVSFFFQPSDIVSQILNFGLPAPIDVQITGRDVKKNFELANKISEEMKGIPGAADVHVHQVFDQPTINVQMDRSKAEQLGITARELANSMLIALASSSQTAPTFWLNPSNGVSYSVATQSPQYTIDSFQALENIPVNTGHAPQLLSNLAAFSRSAEPAVINHYNIAPAINIYAGVQDRDLGAVSREVKGILEKAKKELPRGSDLTVRGQIQTMEASFRGLGYGLIGAIVLVYLLMVVNFQSWTEPFIIITALPGALAGIVWMLFVTGTTMSVPALMGAIMCIGVATANSILIVSFAKELHATGISVRQAVLDAGTGRLRPVIMTALAMIIGMVPMALGLGEGGEQNAPLGRAVIGGLLVATVATLFFVPVVYSLVRGRAEAKKTTRRTREELVTAELN
ncbi:MAG: RND transporter [Verrucomicrobia bacterium Tous-C9LFEB]|nr:MAG: RND transporter [Verrucomicrobia bacterium Tous-C9LFEB]